MSKIKTQLHRIFFKSQEEDYFKLVSAFHNLESAHKKQFEELERLKKAPKPDLADLMRKDLGLITVDFTHQEKGVPKHFLDLPDTLDGTARRKLFISQLFQIQQMDVWPVLMQNLIDTQGNYMLRVGLTDMDIFAGRFQISGISLVKDEVQKGYEDYLEGSKPKEDFDPTDNSTEGIPFISDQKDEDESN